MKYLLLAPDKKFVRGFIESPPIGLSYLATTLRKLGHQVDLKDCIIEGWDNQKTLDYIIATQPDVVGINVFSTALQSVKELTGMIKKWRKRTMVIVGGPHVNGVPKQTLEYFTDVDYAFRGESEIPLMEFDEYQKGKRKIEYVHGLVYRKNGDILFNEKVEHHNLDDFGMPAWDLIEPPKYFKYINVGDKSINVHFSRGCPFSCQFCVKLGTKVRWHSWDFIWKELDYLHETYGVERFIIGDEGFTMFPEKVKEFCREAIARGKQYRYFTAPGLRLNRVDDEMLSLMVEARFEREFGVGIESAVPRVRQTLMNKALTQEDITKGLECLNRHGFKPSGNFILAFPGSTEAEDRESVRWAVKNKLLATSNFVCFIPLPGSPVVTKMIAEGKFPADYDYSQMNYSKVIYAPEGRTLQQVDNLRKWVVWKYNFRPSLILHFLRPDQFVRAFISWYRIYMPNWILPQHWKRI